MKKKVLIMGMLAMALCFAGCGNGNSDSKSDAGNATEISKVRNRLTEEKNEYLFLPSHMDYGINVTSQELIDKYNLAYLEMTETSIKNVDLKNDIDININYLTPCDMRNFDTNWHGSHHKGDTNLRTSNCFLRAVVDPVAYPLQYNKEASECAVSDIVLITDDITSFSSQTYSFEELRDMMPTSSYWFLPDGHVHYAGYEDYLSMSGDVSLTAESSENLTTSCGFDMYYETGTMSWTNYSDEVEEHAYALSIVKIPVDENDDVDLFVFVYDNTKDNSKADMSKELSKTIGNSVLRFEY